MSTDLERNIGKIEVPVSWLHERDKAEALFEALALVPVKIDPHYYADTVFIYGTSPQFTPLAKHAVAPHYDLDWEESADGFITITGVRRR